MLFLKYRVVTISFILSNLRYFKVKQDFAVVIQSLTHVWFWDSINCSTQAFPVFSLSDFAQTHVHWGSHVIQPSHPLLPPSPLALNLSHIRVFQIFWLFASCAQSIGASTSTSVFPMNIQDWFPLRWTGLISFVVQGTFESLLQHHSLKASVLQCSAVYDSPVTPMCD